jgi:hypothetical protein
MRIHAACAFSNEQLHAVGLSFADPFMFATCSKINNQQQLFCRLQVWPGKTVYPDYLENANTSRWLVDNLQHMYDKVPYDGLWLDMNEVGGHCCFSTLLEVERAVLK